MVNREKNTISEKIMWLDNLFMRGSNGLTTAKVRKTCPDSKYQVVFCLRENIVRHYTTV